MKNFFKIKHLDDTVIKEIFTPYEIETDNENYNS